ncbi:CDC39-like protein [Fusarium heterosporum]|uniref:General negative regulator of transcription subunit 1 n=1 Tax=Fusarium heterosporum TaxID=42747 RepID=A0A8H5X223_FUSHE|nr:CDC39-like protein [Fusarium heterosporum]
MVPPPRAGSFSPNPAQTLQTGTSHSPHPSQTAILSAGASPSASSPTGTNSLTKIVVAQVYLLLSTIKEDKDRAKWELQVEQLKKLIDDHGMEVFSKYFTRLVAGNAPQIFPGLNRPVSNPGNYHILVGEMRKISHDIDQASKIAESVESGTEDIFRDFDLSTFMEHFKLDALEKTLLALAFKLGSRTDLKTKADAILSTNFPSFLDIISRPDVEAHSDLTPSFIAVILDRFLQYHPPSFNASSRRDLETSVTKRWLGQTPELTPPSEILAALDLGRVLADRPSNALVRYIQKTGAEFTRDEETCVSYLQNRPSSLQLGPEQVSMAMTFTAISQTPQQNPSVLIAALRRILPKSFDWMEIVVLFDQPTARVSSQQFLHLYRAFLPIAQDSGSGLDIQRLWGGVWRNPEAQLSFVSAYASLTPDQLDATTIPGLQRSITIEDYANSPANVQERANVAVKHPLVSVAALSSIFNVALSSVMASTSIEAKRLFQEVVVPNLDIFLVSAFEVPRQHWAAMAIETLGSLFENFLYKRSPEYDFVLDSLWRKDKEWVMQRLIDAHAIKPADLPLVFEHAIKHNWLESLVYLPNGFGIDLAALAHAEGYLDLSKWARFNSERSTEVSRTLIQFLMIKANMENQFQRGNPDGQPPVKSTTTLQVRTVSALLRILEDYLPSPPVPELVVVQRHCIIAYPRLINYGEGYDDIIDANGREGNSLSPIANGRMEEHYKKMYSDEIQVRHIVEILDQYKHSRDPLDQDVFACMIHGLFDEYTHYADYPLEALATTAVLFGGIISHKLVSNLPLQIGLGMILEAVRDHSQDDPMYKFGLQALMQLFVRFREWPTFCRQLCQIPGLHNTEAFKKAEEVIREHDEELARGHNGAGTPHGLSFQGDTFPNGNSEEIANADRQAPAFASLNVDPPPAEMEFEDPDENAQDKVQFVLNNITEGTIQAMCQELRETMERRHQQWFASHLVEERAKMQPNYHHVYLELVKLFEDKALWSEVLRETYVSVCRMLNSEGTMQNSTERTHLKNLGGWLGLLTLARDRPIKHKNIAFKQLLIEAHDTKRLIVVIPFVCKVLTQGATSAVFRPPNPWLMDIIHLLIELYHHAELKLNLKFEIEVLCKGLNLDHKSIEPSGEILNRPVLEETADVLPPEQLDAFENLSLNGIGSAVGSGLAPPALAPTIPDLGPLINIPPTNEMVVSTTRLHEIVRTALGRALQDIIQPVVDRSVTIAAISTQQMIHKDFAIEPDENRVRTSAISMVKATAGSLALVTSKEPLRANFTNYMRNLSNDLPQGLPEGTIIMCVNSNLDLACNIIEKQAEERAVPEIEEMIEPELEARRRHRIQRPNEAYYDASLSRWAMAIPNPYKLSPNVNGLNSEQMAIYEDFARQPRSAALPTPSHGPSASDATRSIANEVLGDSAFSSTITNVPTPSETPAIQQHLGAQMQPYAPVNVGANAMSNGRTPALQMDAQGLINRVTKLIQELIRAATAAPHEHFSDLPRPHEVVDINDALVQHIIKTSQNSEDFAIYAAEQITTFIFSQIEDNLVLESLVHVLETVRKISGPALNNRVRVLFSQQPGSAFLSLPLLAALVRTDLLEWRNIDIAMSKALQARKEGSLDFLEHLLDLTLLDSRPIALYADFASTLEAAWVWILEQPDSAAGQRIKSKLSNSGLTRPTQLDDLALIKHDQIEYVFEEWIRLCHGHNTSDKTVMAFLHQLQTNQVLQNRDDLFVFIRIAIDVAAERFEHIVHAGALADAYVVVDALAKLIGTFIHMGFEPTSTRPVFIDSILSLIELILINHHVKRGEHLNQRIFFRLLSMLFHEIHAISEDFTENDRREVLLKMAGRLTNIGPVYIPGFIYGWLSLVQHRAFMPAMLQLPDGAGWAPLVDLICQLLDTLGDQMKTFDVSNIAKDIYRATFKLLVILQHDYPEFVAANHIKLCSSIPPHCTQLINAVLAANPQNSRFIELNPKDQIDESSIHPRLVNEAISSLQGRSLLNVIDQALQSGPSEDIVANITHAMTHDVPKTTAYGHVPVIANTMVIDAVVVYIGHRAAEKAAQAGTAMPVSGDEHEVSLLSLIIHELSPEARYYLLVSVVNQLRFPSTYTTFFSQALIYIFGKDMNDVDETELRQEITRVLLERLVSFWPQPWGLLYTVVGLIKSEKYMFFDLPFIKANSEIAGKFAQVLQQA